MSLRAMRKLKGHNEICDVENEDLDELNSDEGERKSKSNIFDLLNQANDSESEKEKAVESETEANPDDNGTSNSNKASKKKQRKQRRRKAKQNTKSNELKESKDDDVLLNSEQASTSKSSQQPVIAKNSKILKVEMRHLNPKNEMRRTFGKMVVKIEHQRNRLNVKNKATTMVTPREEWTPLTKNGILMKIVPDPKQEVKLFTTAESIGTDKQKLQWFAYEYTPEYQIAQNLFTGTHAENSSEFLLQLITKHPFHVDSLIQLSEICKMNDDFALASELIERALYVLESAFCPTFSMTSGTCRLDYRRQENRALFIVLFKHAFYLESRGCCRTALEISKVIMNILPEEDPLAMVLVVDYYAIRSRQLDWFIDYYMCFESMRNLHQLPNMAYSYALALFLKNGATAEANDALLYAMLMFPALIRPLLGELTLPISPRIMSSKYFSPEVSSHNSPALHQLICLYLMRATVIWRQGNITAWLQENIEKMLDKIDREGNSAIADYGRCRSVRYRIPPRPVLRHVLLCDFKEKVPLAKFLISEKQPILSYDPLPPSDSFKSYETTATNSTDRIAQTSNVQPGALWSLFQSIFPNAEAPQRVVQPARNAVALAPQEWRAEAPIQVADGGVAWDDNLLGAEDRIVQVVDMLRGFMGVTIEDGSSNEVSDMEASSTEDELE